SVLPEALQAPNAPTRLAAELAVPQTPTQAAITAGTLGAGPAISAAGKVAPRTLAALEAIPALGKLFTSPAAGRMAGGTMGGGVGGAAEDPTMMGAGKGALLGGATAGVGEGIGALAGPVRQATGTFAREQAARDAQAFGQVIGEISPSL